MTDALPDADGLPSKKRGLRWRHIIMIPIVTVGLALLLGFVWIVRRDANANSKVDARVKELHSRGLPIDNASLAKYYDQLTNNSNVDQWLKLLQILDSKAFSSAAMAHYPWKDEAPSPDGSQPWEGQAEAAEFLKQWSDVRRLAHRLAMQDTKVRIPIKFDGIRTNLENCSRMRQLARLFQLESQIAIRDRNSPATLESILCILGTARSIEGQPQLVGQLVSLAIEGIAIEQVKKAIEQDVFSERDLQVLMKRLQSRTTWSTRWQISLQGDRATSLLVFENPDYYLGEEFVQGWPIHSPWQASGTLAYLDFSEKAIDLPTDDLTVFIHQARQLENELLQRFQSSSLMSKFDDYIFQLIVPGYGALADAFVQMEVQMRLVVVAVGLRQYQKRFKRFPASLKELSELGLAMEQLIPVGGKPFGYRNVNDRVTLWGFRFQTDSSTPDEPPEVNAESLINDSWVWNFQ